MSRTPAHIPGSTHHPGGRVSGFKCVGNYKGDEAWVRRKHEEDMIKRLRNLDRVDEWRDKEKLQNVTHLRKTLITRCAALQPLYFARCQRPDRVEPGLRAAQDRLRISWEAVTGAGASPPERRELAWLQALSFPPP